MFERKSTYIDFLSLINYFVGFKSSDSFLFVWCQFVLRFNDMVPLFWKQN